MLKKLKPNPDFRFRRERQHQALLKAWQRQQTAVYQMQVELQRVISEQRVQSYEARQAVESMLLDQPPRMH